MRMQANTGKGRLVLDFINNYNFITANICRRMFYKDIKTGYRTAAKKLQDMYDNKILTRYRHPQTDEYIYQINKKQINEHHRYAIELYSRINEFADEVLYFTDKEKDVAWKNSKRRSDFHIVYKYKDKLYALLGEVDFSHFTSKNKLMDIYLSGDVQEWYRKNYDVEDFFPTIVILNVLGNCEFKDIPFDLISIDFYFEKLEKALGVV